MEKILYFILFIVIIFFTNNRFAATCSGSYYWIKKFNTFQKYQKYTIMSLRTTIRQWLHKNQRYEPTVWMTSTGNSERKPYSIWERCMRFRYKELMLIGRSLNDSTEQMYVAASLGSRECLPKHRAKSHYLVRKINLPWGVWKAPPRRK